jgi:hypothetical protein
VPFQEDQLITGAVDRAHGTSLKGDAAKAKSS